MYADLDPVREIWAVVQQIPAGRVLAADRLRLTLAHAHGSDYSCPLTTGIFLRIGAKAAEMEPRSDVPWRRVVQPDGKLMEKLPGGPEHQAALLAREGIPPLDTTKLPKVAGVT